MASGRLPSLFIGCAREHLFLAEAIQQNLQHRFDVRVWNQGVFQLNRSALESLLDALTATDFAVFVFAPADIVVIRGTSKGAVRDNVAFEFGMFLGAKGRDRTFFLVPRDQQVRVLTDLLGVKPAEYSSAGKRKDWQAILGPACTEISNHILKLLKREGHRRTTLDDLKQVSNELKALLPQMKGFRYQGAFPAYLPAICECLCEAREEIRVLCDFPTYGFFSDNDGFNKYCAALAERRMRCRVQMIVLNKEQRAKYHQLQFAHTEGEWSKLKKRREFKKRLDEFSLRIARPVKTLKDFQNGLVAVQDNAIRHFPETTVDELREVDAFLPIHLWIADKRRAVLSIPTFGANSDEHGFETCDGNLIASLRSIWERYSAESKPAKSSV